MVRLKPRKNNYSKPKGTNKKKLGTSISERPEEIEHRNVFGHWEADLVQGKKGKDEPVILTLVERCSRYAMSRKLADAKSHTVHKALLSIVQQAPECFDSITFDNGSEFSQSSTLEEEDDLKLKVYFCHAYSAWEKGSNENFNKLIREFMPKGQSLHRYSDDDVIEAGQSINQRVREVNDFQSAEAVFNDLSNRRRHQECESQKTMI